jgi:predicted DNA-binding transcriptional regulator AlpA
VPAHEDDPYLDTEAVAGQAGVTIESIRIYLKRTRRRLAAGQQLRSQDLPLPDITVGRSPAWLQSTITEWIANRVGPGRPPTRDK